MSDRVVRDQLDIQMSELNSFIRILSLAYSEIGDVFKNSFYEFGIRVNSFEFTEEISNCFRSLPSCATCLFERRSIKGPPPLIFFSFFDDPILMKFSGEVCLGLGSSQ